MQGAEADRSLGGKGSQANQNRIADRSLGGKGSSSNTFNTYDEGEEENTSPHGRTDARNKGL